MLLLGLLASAGAFLVPTSPQTPSRIKFPGVDSPSQSMPWLEAPAGIDTSMVGAEAQFDPLNLSDIVDQSYARTAEIKHGRIAMLACVGVIAQTKVHWFGDAYTESDFFAAISKVGWGINAQIFVGIGILELVTLKTTFGDDGARLGFDPLGYWARRTPEQRRRGLAQELANGRAAMIGIMGFFAAQVQPGAVPMVPNGVGHAADWAVVPSYPVLDYSIQVVEEVAKSS